MMNIGQKRAKHALIQKILLHVMLPADIRSAFLKTKNKTRIQSYQKTLCNKISIN